MNVKARPLSFCALLLVLALASCGGEESATRLAVSKQPAPPTPFSTHQAFQNNQGFALWLDNFKREALTKGISPQVLNAAFAGVTEPSQKVLDRDHTQPEKTKSFDEYATGFLKQRKIEAARDQWDSHREILSQVQQAYGVPAPILLALWQTESGFGKNQGNYSIIESLATLAYDGRRSAFFRTQLLDALTILQQEHMPPESLTGSWAGAMGQDQFMPSSFLSFAVDFDGDGRKDIWHDDADALGSMANYLKTRGWNSTLGWGFRVRVPEGADAASWAQAKEWHSLKEWKMRGLKSADGKKLPQAAYETRLVLPDNNPEYAYLVTANYDVIMDWNHSTYFATGIGLLADAIAAGE